MLFLLSGEGPTDFGECCRPTAGCEGDEFLPGPIAVVLAAVVEEMYGYSLLEPGRCRLVPRVEVRRVANALRPVKVRVRGRKRLADTRQFETSARALAALATDLARQRNEVVVAALFFDADTSDRAIWRHQWDAMLDGFRIAEFDHGIPVMPQPTSEAWLLCLLAGARYPSCEPLESRSGSPKAPQPLKAELRAVLGEDCTRQSLTGRLAEPGVAWHRLDLPSFRETRERIAAVVGPLARAGGSP